jgi:hypothetical protein
MKGEVITLNERRKLERFDLKVPAKIQAVDKDQGRGELNLITKDICAGGAFFNTTDPLPKETQVKIDLILDGKLRSLVGKQAHVKVTGMVLRSDSMGMAIGFDEDYKIISLVSIRKRSVRWNASTAPNVIGYKLYWTVGGGVNYDSDFAEVGNVTKVILPDDIPSFPILAHDIELGVAAVDHIGNESDIITFPARFDFTAPEAPAYLTVETI